VASAEPPNEHHDREPNQDRDQKGDRERGNRSDPRSRPSTPELSTAIGFDDETIRPPVAKLQTLSRWERARIVARLVLRIVATTTLLLVVYYAAPLEDDTTPDGSTLALLVIGLTMLGAMIVWQTRLIVNADYPGLRAVEALAVTTPLYLIIFAASYYLIGESNPASFTEPLDRTSSLYFTVTVFATVGFGDIAAKTQLARIVVMIQMVLDLLILGLGLRLFLGAVKVGQRRREGRSSPG